MLEKIKSFFNNNELDLTSGNLFKKQILFAIPIILSSFANLLFTSVDLIMVNRLGDGNLAMAGVAASAPIIGVIVGAITAFSMGTTVLVSQAKGAKDKIKANKLIHSSIIIGLILGLITAIALYFLTPSLLNLSKTPDDVFEYASTYIKIYLVGVPFIIIYNFAAASLRSFGDSKRPLYILLICGALNVLLNYIFIGPCNLSVFGVGLATSITQALSCILVLLILFLDKRCFTNLAFKQFRFYLKEIKDILIIGSMNMIQTLILAISNFIIQRVVNEFGSNATIGNAAADSLGTYVFQLMSGFVASGLAMSGQNYGAKNKDNCNKSLKYTMILVTASGLIGGGFILALSKPLLNCFIDSNDPNYQAIYDIAFLRLLILMPTYFLCGIRDGISGYLRGLKYAFIPTLISIVGSILLKIVFFVTLYQLDVFHNLTWAYLTYPIFWLITIIIYLIFLKKLKEKAYIRMLEEEIKE